MCSLAAGPSLPAGHTHMGMALPYTEGKEGLANIVSTDQSELTAVIHSNFVHGSRDYKPSMALTHACMCDQMGREGL